ncbi:hypothetical protein F9K94_15545 [Brucella tritici]|uniref:Uncharacterized protein n=1 Tax=Brucella tritici TaxID=94626 RepID=A0A7V7VSG4_9HYPH|nr:hypothetical protein [Brucella tritici]KAB2655939.1 hypothetical protein F9K94_15545 [Brucella tritici]
MNLERINKATECIESNEKALKWLRNNHERLVSSGLFTVTVSIDQTFAHTGTGVREAMATISAFAKHNIEKSIEDSIANCINTIAIERDAILREVSSNAE